MLTFFEQHHAKCFEAMLWHEFLKGDPDFQSKMD